MLFHSDYVHTAMFTDFFHMITGPQPRGHSDLCPQMFCAPNFLATRRNCFKDIMKTKILTPKNVFLPQTGYGCALSFGDLVAFKTLWTWNTLRNFHLKL